MIARALRRLRPEQGQSLIEMLAAMALLSIAVAGLLAAFSSSIVGMTHAGKEGTALALADRQMEAYRSLPYSCLALGTTPSGCPSFAGFPNPYSSSQSVSSTDSPDHRAYTVTTTMTTSAGQTKVVVSVAAQSGGSPLARASSAFSSAGAA